MTANGCPLHVHELADVNHVSEFALRCAEGIAVVGGCIRVPVLAVGAACPSVLTSEIEEPLHRITVHGRLEHSRRAGQFGGTVANGVHLDVVGVTVVAVPVVCGQHVGRFFLENLPQRACGFVQRCLHERAGVLILLPPSHTAVGVVQKLQPGDAQRCSGLCSLCTPPIYQGFTPDKITWRFAVVAVGGDHQHHAMALSHCARY